MNIIIPMAGMGKRMRPHTLTIPKPLIPVAGKPIVQWLVEDLAGMCDEQIEEIAFVIGDFGKEVEKQLTGIAGAVGAKGTIYYQEEALGTGHAVLCAADSLQGKVIVAFADTLFRSDFRLDASRDGVVWVHKVEDPRAFGVVKVDDDNVITDFVEKPEEFVSDLAIIGIYYFKDGDNLKKELQYLIDNDIKDKGEYQLTSALENIKSKGGRFSPGAVTEWLDCGNKNATVYTNQRILEHHKADKLIAGNIKTENTVIIEPCFIGEGVEIRNAVVGPYVSVGENTIIEDSVVKNSIVQNNTVIKGINFSDSMVGNFVVLSEKARDLSIGDYVVEEN